MRCSDGRALDSCQVLLVRIALDTSIAGYILNSWTEYGMVLEKNSDMDPVPSATLFESILCEPTVL
jgi:hypothetical protein